MRKTYTPLDGLGTYIIPSPCPCYGHGNYCSRAGYVRMGQSASKVLMGVNANAKRR